MRYITGIIICLSFCKLQAQTVILERTEDGVMDSTFSTVFSEDENKKWQRNDIIGIGFPVTQSDAGGKIENGSSDQLTYGFMYLYKPVKFFGAGFDLTYNFYNYRLAQDTDKILPVGYAGNDIETIRLNCLQAGPMIRINFMPKQNRLGNYLDLGADAVWVMGSNHRTINENEDGSQVKIKTSKLDYTERFQYILNARLGFGPVALYGSYRLTNVFKEEFNYPELPNVNIGIELLMK